MAATGHLEPMLAVLCVCVGGGGVVAGPYPGGGGGFRGFS